MAGASPVEVDMDVEGRLSAPYYLRALPDARPRCGGRMRLLQGLLEGCVSCIER